MNYYAVCALKARVYLWIGNKAKALEYAKLVIDAATPEGARLSAWVPGTTVPEVTRPYQQSILWI